MTVQELYSSIGEDYEQALRVLRTEKLVDKHIRKLTKNGPIEALLAAGEGMDATQLFETAHAAKGNCGNLGLTKLYKALSEIAEEFRPGNPRKMTDAEVSAKLQEIAGLYEKTADAINAIEGAPVSDYARRLSASWARGELTGEQLTQGYVMKTIAGGEQ